MKKRSIRLLSILLTVAMLFSMVPAVYADDTGSETGTETSVTEIDLDAFIKNVEEANYNYDGKGITVKWSPATGCSQLEREHECTAGKVAATGNTPSRANSDGYAQYQLFKGDETDVTIKNVNFVYEPATFTLCANTDWEGTVTDTIPAEFQFENVGSTSLINCTFEKIGLSIWSEAADTTALITGCKFSNVNADQFTATSYGDYAIHYIKNGKIYVSNNTFENVCRGLMVYAPNNTETYIANNDFSGVAEGEAMVKVDGTNTDATIVVSGNTDTNNRGTVCRVLQEVTVHAAEGDNITFTSNSTYKNDVVKADATTVTVAEDGTITATIESGTTSTAVAKIGNAEYETLDDAIDAAADGQTIVVSAGEYTLTASSTLYTGKAITIKAAEGAKVSFDMTNAAALHGAKITFEDVTFNYKTNGDYIGLQHTDTLVYNNCEIVGKAFLYAKSETFNNCTFTQTIEDYNVWTYGAKNVAFNNCIFNCVGKAVHAYTEADNADAAGQKISVTGCTVNSTKENKAFLNIKNSTRSYDVTFSGENTVTVNGEVVEDQLYQVETTTITESYGKGVTVKKKAADGTVTTIYEVKAPVAKTVDGKTYSTLAEALAAVSESNALTYVTEDAWPSDTPVYYDGAFYKTHTVSYVTKGALDWAIEAANTANSDEPAKIYVRPGYNTEKGVVANSHQNIKTSIAVYGNDASLCGVGWEPTVEYPGENYHTLTKDISIEIYNLHDGASVWGQRMSSYTVNVILANCNNVHELMLNGENASAVESVTNYTVRNCTFDGNGASAACPITTTGAGKVVVEDCTFANLNNNYVVNINNKLGGETTVEVKNTSFANCGATGKEAVRLTGEAEGSTISATLSGLTFDETTAENAIIVGNRKSENNNADVSYTITGTSGTLNLLKQGTTTPETTELEKAEDYTGTNLTGVAKIGDTKYATLADAIAAANAGDTVTLLTDVTEDVVINKNITLDLVGKTLKNTNAGKATISVTGGTVTVKNGTVVGGTSYYNIEVTKGSNANLTLEEVTATAGNTGSSMIDNWGTMTITSGVYTGGLNVVKSEEGSVLSITGGKFTLDYAPSNGYTGVILVYGDTTISGGEFIQNVTTTGKWSHPEVILTGIVEGYTAITKVTGGNFVNNKSGEDIFRGYGKATSANFEVTGGTFNKTVSDSFFMEGYFAMKNADGTYGAAGPFAAKVNSTAGYGTLAEAIAAAKAGDTVTLLTDVEVNEPITVNTAITLDLGGKTLTSTWTMPSNAAGAARYALVNNAKMKLTNGTFNVSQARGVGAYAGLEITSLTMTQELTGGHACVALCANDATYTIKSSTTISGDYAVAIFANNATVSISGSKLNGTTCGLYHNGSNYSLNLSVINTTINGSLDGTVGNENDPSGVYISGSASHGTMQQASFKNCTIKGATAIEVKYTDLTLDKCTVEATVKTPSYSKNNNGMTALGFAVVSTDNSKAGETPAPAGTVKITGNGKYTGPVGLGSLESVKAEFEDFTDNTIKVSGGTFTNEVPEEYCAEGYIPTKNEDGTYGVKQGAYVAKVDGVKYETLQEAINAAKGGTTVTLVSNTRENVTISKKLTLDLNGFTLNGGQVKATPALKVDNASVTVRDSSEAQTGTIMREDTAVNSGVTSHYVIDIQGKNGFLKFEGGNVVNTSGTADRSKGASLVRLGDDSVNAYPTLTINGGTFTQDNFIAIKVDRGTLHLQGGTVNSANSYAIENWNNAYIKADSTVNGTVSTWVYSTGAAFSKLEISGGTVNGNVASVNYDKAADKQARIFITGGEVTGTLGTYTYSSGLVPTDETAMATIEVTAGTFGIDPTKYVVEGSTVNTNGDGKFGVEKAYLAKVGETSYYTMDEAYKAAAEGGTIVMLRDYKTDKIFNSGISNRTVDLNGHTWTYTGTDTDSAAFEINDSDVTLTVKNGAIVSSTMVGLIPSAMSGTITYDKSGLVFEGVTATAKGHSGIETNGNNTNDSITLKNSTLNVLNGYGIYFPSSGTLTIENSVINAKTMGVQLCAGSLVISGDDTAITVTGDGVEKTEGDGAIEDGAAISIVNRTGYKGLAKIEVKGGTFKANGTNDAIKAYDYANKAESDFTESTKVSVSSGTFSTAVPEDLCADGYIPTTVSEGVYGVKVGKYVAEVNGAKYETLSAAIAAANEGDTVTLIADFTTDASKTNMWNWLRITKDITLDLSGHVMTIPGELEDSSNWAAFFISAGTLTVTDSSEAGTGAIVGADKTDTSYSYKGGVYLFHLMGGNLVIESGTYYAGGTVVNVEKGTATVKGGTFSVYPDVGTNDSRYILNCVDANYENGTAHIVVEGGTFKGYDPRNNLAEGTGTDFVAPGVGVDANSDGTFTAKSGMVAQRIDAAGNSVKAYNDLASALGAAKSGETVMLLSDITIEGTSGLSATLEIAELTIDLNGHKIDGSSVSDYNAAALSLRVGDDFYYSCTIKFISSEQGGAILGNLPLKIEGAIYVDAARVEIDDNVTLTVQEGGENAVLLGNSTIYLVATDHTKTFYSNGGFMATTSEGEGRIYEELGGAQRTSKTVTLLNDYKTGSTLNIQASWGNVILNLDNHTYESSAWKNRAFDMREGASITFKNGTLKATDTESTVIGSTYNNATITLENVTVEAAGYYGIAINGNRTNNTVTLINSTISAPNGVGVYFPSTGTLTINGGEITGTTGVQLCAGSLTITGNPTITATGGGTGEIGGGSIEDGAAVSIVTRSGYGAIGSVTIESGTFKSAAGVKALQVYEVKNNEKIEWADAGTKVNISGGTFSSIPANMGALCAASYIPVRNADGTYTVKLGDYVAEVGDNKYATLAEAIEAAEDGETVTLLADAEQNSMLIINKNITLDLNGKKIYNTVDIWDVSGAVRKNAVIGIENGAKVTITGNGTIEAKENDCYTINVKSGELTIENGTFIGNVSAVQVETGKLTINGGEFKLLQKWDDGKGNPSRYLINCIDANYKDNSAVVDIKGGTFENFDPNRSPEAAIEGKVPSYVISEGVGITKNENGTFTAVPNMVAQIVDAEGNSVKAYADMYNACMSALSGQTIVLLTNSDRTMDAIVCPANTTLTIDLNGYEYCGNEWSGHFTAAIELSNPGVNLTVKNGKISSWHYEAIAVLAENCKLTLENVDLISNKSTSWDTGRYGIAANGIASGSKDSSAGLQLTLKNCTLTTKNSSVPTIAIYFPVRDSAVQKAKLEIIDTKITGFHTGVQAISGTTEISGEGTKIETIGAPIKKDGGDGPILDGSAISVVDRAGYGALESVTVSGGTFVAAGDGSVAMKAYHFDGNTESEFDNSENVIAVSGGEFSNIVDADHCAIGYVPVTEADPETGLYTVKEADGNAYYVNDDGKVVYGDLEDLVTDKKTLKKVITLLKDVEKCEWIFLNKGRTIELNGKTLAFADGEGLTVVTGTISDNTNGNGLVKVAAANVKLASNNGQLPIYDTDAGGYRLFDCKMNDAKEEPKEDGSVKLWLVPIFTNTKAYELLTNGNAHNTTIGVEVSWTNETGTGAQTFAFNQAQIDTVAKSFIKEGATKMAFYIVLTGLNSDLSGSISDIKAQSSISSNTGASVSGTGYSIK